MCDIVDATGISGDQMTVIDRVEGVVIGVLHRFQGDHPMVTFEAGKAGAAFAARSLVELADSDVGCEVALLFEGGDPQRPLIAGKLMSPILKEKVAPIVTSDGKDVVVNAEERIELRVGKASIVLEKDGHVTIRGSRLISHASGANQIRGGSVDLN